MNNELIASLRLGRKIVSEDSETLDQVVNGRHFISLRSGGGGSGGGCVDPEGSSKKC
jgi:hypothetical protein